MVLCCFPFTILWVRVISSENRNIDLLIGYVPLACGIFYVWEVSLALLSLECIGVFVAITSGVALFLGKLGNFRGLYCVLCCKVLLFDY